MIFDSHCHLDPETYGGDAAVDSVVATAKAAGVERMLTVGSGYGEGTAGRAVEVANRHPGVVWASVGVHPHDARFWSQSLEEELRALAGHDCVVAWGEIGLDFFYDNSPRDVQRRVLKEQISVGLELGLPLIIHDRDSENETFRILCETGAFEGKAVLYHCFAGDPLHMAQIVDAGGYISIPGSVTWRKTAVTQEVAKVVPLERLLVETDSPFLTPEPLRGRRNEPCHVALTLDRIAEIRDISPATLAAATTANACRVFGLEQPA